MTGTHSFPTFNRAATPAVVVDQGHARLHYAVPLAVHKAGMLRAAVCDYYSDGGKMDRVIRAGIAAVAKGTAQRMKERRSLSLPTSLVVQDRARTLALDAARHISKRSAATHWDRWSAWRAPLIETTVRRTKANVIHGFVSSLHPPLLKSLRERGTHCSGDQVIAATHVLRRESQIQDERFKGWMAEGQAMELGRLESLERETWPLLERITCASDFVRAGLVEAGLGGERVHVLPYPFARTGSDPGDRPSKPSDSPLTVGFVGTVSLRKGAPYFLQLARRLASPTLRFEMVGPIQLTDKIVQEYSDCVDFVGPVSRRKVEKRLEQFNVFLFPSTCEGSAGVIYEAANAGVPIVTSPNSGTHLKAPEEVAFRDYADIDGLCAEVVALVESPALRQSRASAAWRALDRCSIEAYSSGIANVFREMCSGQS